MLLLLVAGAQTPESDPAVEPSVWSGDVTVDADLTVPTGDTLVIEPGTHVTVATGVKMVIEGAIEAIGTEDQPIEFTGERT